jgi:hypothetical protein
MSTQKPVPSKGPAPAQLPPENEPQLDPIPIKPKGPAPFTIPPEKPSK